MHAARIASGAGISGIAQGYKTRFLQDEDGQLQDTHSIAAGLDYVGVSPILADLHEKKKVRFELARDMEVIEAHSLLMKQEGIIAALESSHALACAFREMGKYTRDDVIIINISGR
jgi:tryptophan synthase beta chain